MKRRMRFWLGMISLLLVGALTLSGCAIRVEAEDLMAEIEPAAVAGKAADDAFIASQAALALKLMKAAAAERAGENLMLSPLSIQLALAMTANGADGATRAEMEALLGGSISLEELNEYLYSYVQDLPSEEAARLEVANSIWYRDGAALSVEPAFLQTNADYYGAQIYKAPFDRQTLADINNWVGQHTDGMIDQILEEIGGDAMMYLINAIAFDAKWEEPYEEQDVRERSFTDAAGATKDVEMMHSEEGLYLSDGEATGFLKDYKGGRYRFGALLPREGLSPEDYLAGRSGEAFLALLEGAESAPVQVALPKFEAEYEQPLNGMLKGLGMPTAFDAQKADFSRMGTLDGENLCIDQVLHKTYISVDEKGTRAAAVTSVNEGGTSFSPGYAVTLDRPFVYFILDNETGLPLFIGILNQI